MVNFTEQYGGVNHFSHNSMLNREDIVVFIKQIEPFN